MKKSLITIIVIIVVLIAGWYFWKGGFIGHGIGTSNSVLPNGETSQTGMGGAGETATTGQTGNVEKVTDDVYVELMAQAAYLSQKSPATYVTEIQKLYSKYGLNQESFAAYGEELSKDPTRAQAIAQKYTQRLQELMK